MPKLLWFRQDRDETAILDTLAALAAQHGYINQRGPKHGAGNVAELMAAIAAGEVKLLLLPDEQQTLATEHILEDRRFRHPTLKVGPVPEEIDP